MSSVSRPTQYLSWTSGLGPNNVQPPPELRATGWQAGQPVPAAYFNWVTWLTDQWIQYLSEGINSTVLATSLDHSMRLIGGGTFAYNASTNVLSWSAPLYIAIPSIPDADNAIAAGQVTVPAGSVAYSTVNLPFTTTGDLTTGSTTVANVGFEGSISVGQAVTGTGIANNTTVTAIKGTSLTLSTAATATASQATLTFASTGALTVSVATSQSLVPNPQTTVLARSLGAAISVGVGSTELWLRDQEQRSLVTAGYVTTVQAMAGAAINALQPVYMSQGSADGRTQGNVYPCDAGATNGAQRGYCVGFAHTQTPSGSLCHVVQGGFLSGFSGLTPGAVYYLDPTTIGGITSTKPSTNGQYVAPIGVATSTSQLLIHISPDYPVTNVFSGIVVNGTSQLNGNVTVTGNETVSGSLSAGNGFTANGITTFTAPASGVIFKPTAAGASLLGYPSGGSNPSWSIIDTGAGNFSALGTSALTSTTANITTQTSNSITTQNFSYAFGIKSNLEMGSLYVSSSSGGGLYQTYRTIWDSNANALRNTPMFQTMPFSGSIMCIMVLVSSQFQSGQNTVQIKARTAGGTFKERVIYQQSGLVTQTYGNVAESAIILYFNKGQLPFYGEDMLSMFIATSGGGTLYAIPTLTVEYA